MHTVSINLRYRPLRFGWCVKKGDFAALRRAAKLSFTMWGGCFNPIIPTDDPALGDALIRLFRVDALAPASDQEDVRAFIKMYKHLPWPLMGDELFADDMRDKKRPRVVDISHSIKKHYEEHYRNNPNPQPGIDLVRWDAEDPLADMLLFSFGGVPDASEAGVDYLGLAGQGLFGIPAIVVNGAELPPLDVERMTLVSLNEAFLRRHYVIRNHWDFPGFYIGQADDFDDLVTFWNLKAADIQLKFHDVRYPERFRTVNAFWTDRLTKTLGKDRDFHGIALWHRREREIPNHSAFGARVMDCAVDDTLLWNGGNVRAPFMYFGEGSALASVGEGGETPRISFALTGQPFSQDVGGYDEHYVLSVHPFVGLFGNERATLHAPFIPELNEFYGRNCHFVWNEARAEPDGLGIIISTTATDLSLRSMSVPQLIGQVFECVGIEATPSRAGLVGTSLIRQMGGLEGCRPFKIAGVRKLIENFRSDESFSRACAKQTILGRDTDCPLSGYQSLYIEPRKIDSELTPDAVLSYLLDRGVFRAGLKFACPSCQLDFWLSLDEAKSRLECQFCGHVFNASRQLRDKDWAFRRSGLFGRADNQEGAVPVTLTLQQLMRMRLGDGIYTTAMDLKPKGATILSCETDFVVLTTRGHDRKVQIAVGECKTRQPITADDVRKLKAVADAFPAEKYDVYVVFAKLNSFAAEEIECIKSVNSRYCRRAIMLTDRELEPYFVYERTAKEFDIKGTTVSFEDMAIVTDRVFFQNLRREVGVAPGEETG